MVFEIEVYGYSFLRMRLVAFFSKLSVELNIATNIMWYIVI